MRIKGSHRFGDYSNPHNNQVIENYFDEVMGVVPEVGEAESQKEGDNIQNDGE